MKHKFILLLSALLISFIGNAQTAVSTEPEMADKFRSEGKIYVVISVLSIVFICLIGYLITIDRKLKKLEDKK